jgi:hypothetical protein
MLESVIEYRSHTAQHSRPGRSQPPQLVQTMVQMVEQSYRRMLPCRSGTVQIRRSTFASASTQSHEYDMRHSILLHQQQCSMSRRSEPREV